MAGQPAGAPAATPETIIRTKGLTKRYGELTAVDRLDLDVRRGEVFGLLGPNGAGKTTTILMLLGLSEPTAGEARVDGLDPTRQPLEVKRRVGYLPDNVGFYGSMSGRQNLRYTCRLNGFDRAESEERIARLRDEVGLSDAADRPVETYSRGMKQRLGIADALVGSGLIVGLVVGGYGGAAVYISPLAKYLIAEFGLSGSFIGLGVLFAVVVIVAGQLLAWPPAGYVPPAPPALAPRQQGMTRADWSAPEMLRTWQFYALVFLFIGSAQSGLLVIANATPMLNRTAAAVAFFAANAWLLASFGGLVNATGRVPGRRPSATPVPSGPATRLPPPASSSPSTSPCWCRSSSTRSSPSSAT